MESIFFVIAYIVSFFNGTGKKVDSIFSKIGNRSKSNDFEDVQELTDEEYNRRFSKFFTNENESYDNSFEKPVNFRQLFDRDRFYVKWSDSWMQNHF